MNGFRDKNPDPNAPKRFDDDDLSIDDIEWKCVLFILLIKKKLFILLLIFLFIFIHSFFWQLFSY